MPSHPKIYKNIQIGVLESTWKHSMNHHSADKNTVRPADACQSTFAFHLQRLTSWLDVFRCVQLKIRGCKKLKTQLMVKHFILQHFHCRSSRNTWRATRYKVLRSADIFYNPLLAASKAPLLYYSIKETMLKMKYSEHERVSIRWSDRTESASCETKEFLKRPV